MTTEVTDDLVIVEPIAEATTVAGQEELMLVHGTLARAMRARLKTGLATAAEWNSIRAFLADNGISSGSGQDDSERKLREDIARKRQERNGKNPGIAAEALARAAELANRNLT